MKQCIVCSKPLTGRQQSYCSKQCKIADYDVYGQQRQRGIDRKLELVEQFGGGCSQCGYDRNLAALSFHHRDSSTKSHKLDIRNISIRSMAATLAEAEKCELLCANCHMALHSPDMAFATIEQLLDRQVEDAPEAGRCVTCGNELTGRQTRFCSSGCKNAYLQDYGRQRERGIRRKLELVMALGGCCARCGYAENLAALNFHHDDELLEKSFKLDLRSLANRTLDAVRAEAEKCVLLCANCHAETHNRALAIPTKQKRTPIGEVRS